ncbi:sulfate adenylyltransferase, partial [mine drainage metagenome]
MIPDFHGKKITKIPELNIEEYSELTNVKISLRTTISLNNLRKGILSPLVGFNSYEDTMEIMKESRLPGGVPWSIPLLLPVENETFQNILDGDMISLNYNSKVKAILSVEEKFSIDRNKYCQKIYGTDDKLHPGVESMMKQDNSYLSGKILGISSDQEFSEFSQVDPIELRKMFKARNFKSVTAFQTRNPPHRGHEFLHKFALLTTDALLLNPVIGPKKPGDFSDNEIFESYKIYVDNYLPQKRVFLYPLIYTMHYAGPREALMHMIMRKNLGCS